MTFLASLCTFRNTSKIYIFLNHLNQQSRAYLAYEVFSLKKSFRSVSGGGHFRLARLLSGHYINGHDYNKDFLNEPHVISDDGE